MAACQVVGPPSAMVSPPGPVAERPPNSAPLPLIKTNDRLYLELAYKIMFNEGLGIYVRGAGDTQILPTIVPVTEPTTVTLINADGTVGTLALGANDSFRIAEALWSRVGARPPLPARTMHRRPRPPYRHR